MDPKTKAFDCVAESRKWREAASAKLNAMSLEERLAYLDDLGERVRAELRQHQSGAGKAVVHEDSPGCGTKKS